MWKNGKGRKKKASATTNFTRLFEPWPSWPAVADRGRSTCACATELANSEPIRAGHFDLAMCDVETCDVDLRRVSCGNFAKTDHESRLLKISCWSVREKGCSACPSVWISLDWGHGVDEFFRCEGQECAEIWSEHHRFRLCDVNCKKWEYYYYKETTSGMPSSSWPQLIYIVSMMRYSFSCLVFPLFLLQVEVLSPTQSRLASHWKLSANGQIEAVHDTAPEKQDALLAGLTRQSSSRINSEAAKLADVVNIPVFMEWVNCVPCVRACVCVSVRACVRITMKRKCQMIGKHHLWHTQYL